MATPAACPWSVRLAGEGNEVPPKLGRAHEWHALWADIEKQSERLAQRPALGHRRKDLTEDADILFYQVRDCYLVIYRRDIRPLEIARVRHGARDIAPEWEAD